VDPSDNFRVTIIKNINNVDSFTSQKNSVTGF
jgi:hypothetical protein